MNLLITKVTSNPTTHDPTLHYVVRTSIQMFD